MKRILFTVTALLLSASIASAQAKLSQNQQAVQQVVTKVFDALSNRDSVSLKNYCTPDVAFYEYGEVWNLDSMIQKTIIRNTAADFKRVNKLDFVNTSVSENTAWATYNLYSEIMRAGTLVTIHWMETVVAVKVSGTWKLKVLHSSLIKRT